jgi:predicted ATPase
VIRRIGLRNFKCFEGLELEVAPLTLFTGLNAGGKSTTVQTLLLLEQTLRGPHNSPCLMLNGPIVNLGTPGDVLSASSGAKWLLISVGTEESLLTWHFRFSENRLLEVDSIGVEEQGQARSLEADERVGIRPNPGVGPTVLDAIEGVIYLGAARQVETDVYPAASGVGLPLGDVGPIGQYAPWWLHECSDNVAPAGRMHSEHTSRSTIRQQINAWLGDLFPGAEANSVPVERTNLMRLGLRSTSTSDWVRPANIGYGISYAFPIVVAGLCAAQGGTVVLDSPEAHLHPQAQSRVGRFLSQVAGSGVQMLIETHSDHVLNGVRIAVRDGVIPPDDVAIYFFTGVAEPQVIRLLLDKNGTISDIPVGFFDQAERDLSNLAGWDL